MNLNFACRKCFSIDESNSLRLFFAMLWMRKRCRSHKKKIKISLSLKNEQNSSKIEFNSSLMYLSINIRNHNKDDFLCLYNARNNFRIFLNCLYLFDIWQYIFLSLKTIKKTFTTFNYLILKWKSTINVIIMRNIFNANVAAYTFWALFTFCKSSWITMRVLYLKRNSFKSDL
jgi:hypothetical protein